MSPTPTVVASIDDVARALDAGAEQVEVVIDDAVPEWLGAAVAAVHRRGGRCRVRAVVPPGFDGEALDGWQIGVATAALLASVDEVVGVDARRMARVQAIVERVGR